MSEITRRDLIAGAAGLAAGATLGLPRAFAQGAPTYTPEEDNVTSTCNASGAIGKALEYEVDILTGKPTLTDDPYAEPKDDEAPIGDPECSYRCRETAGPIPPEPVLVFQDPKEDDDEDDPNDPDDGQCDGIAKVAMVIGTQVTNPGICTAPVRTYWYAQQDQ